MTAPHTMAENHFQTHDGVSLFYRHRPAQGHRRGYPQQAAGRVGQLSHTGEAALDLHEGFAGGLDQPLAGFGEAQAAGGTAHQGHAGRQFELADALADGGLAHPQPCRRPGVAAGLGEHAEPMHVAPQGFDLLFFHGLIVQYSEQ